MASIVLTNVVGNPQATLPESINISLSSKNVVVESLAATVKYIAFNNTPVTLTGNYQTLSAGGTTFRVDTAYNGIQFAVINKDNTSLIFTAVTGTGTAPSRAIYLAQTTTANDYNTVTFESLRLWNLNG